MLKTYEGEVSTLYRKREQAERKLLKLRLSGKMPDYEFNLEYYPTLKRWVVIGRKVF